MNISESKYDFQFYLSFFIILLIATYQADGFCGIQNGRQPFVYNIEWVYQGSDFSLNSTIDYKFHNHFNYKFKDIYISFVTSNSNRIAQYNNFCDLIIKSQYIIQTDIAVYIRKQNWIFAVQTDNVPADFLS